MITQGRVFDKPQFTTVSDHISATVRTGHGFSDKGDIVVYSITNRKYVRTFDVRISDIQHKCGKINIWNDKFLPS